MSARTGEGNKFHRVPIHKPRIRPDELEFPTLQLLSSVTGKTFDHLRLPGHDFAKVESDLAGFETPRRSVLRQVSYFSRIEQGGAMVRPFRRGLFNRVGLNVGTPVAAAEAQPELLRERVARLLAA